MLVTLAHPTKSEIGGWINQLPAMQELLQEKQKTIQQDYIGQSFPLAAQNPRTFIPVSLQAWN
jgi:hypothetical protein